MSYVLLLLIHLHQSMSRRHESCHPWTVCVYKCIPGCEFPAEEASYSVYVAREFEWLLAGLCMCVLTSVSFLWDMRQQRPTLSNQELGVMRQSWLKRKREQHSCTSALLITCSAKGGKSAMQWRWRVMWGEKQGRWMKGKLIWAEYVGGGVEGEGWSCFDGGRRESAEAMGELHEKLQREWWEGNMGVLERGNGLVGVLNVSHQRATWNLRVLFIPSTVKSTFGLKCIFGPCTGKCVCMCFCFFQLDFKLGDWLSGIWNIYKQRFLITSVHTLVILEIRFCETINSPEVGSDLEFQLRKEGEFSKTSVPILQVSHICICMSGWWICACVNEGVVV